MLSFCTNNSNKDGRQIFPAAVDWDKLGAFADRLSHAGLGPGSVPEAEWTVIERSLYQLRSAQDWPGIIRLRELFGFLVKGETTGGMALIQLVNEAAIHAAEQVKDRKLLARYFHDSGENYHRQGYHYQSIEAFERAHTLYEEEGDKLRARESYYFSSLPYRAIGKTARAREILERVLREVPPDDPWRANPLQVMSWMARDAGQFCKAEKLLRDALALYERHEGPESIHVVQTLADLGEITGLQKRLTDATVLFEESLAIVEKFGGQYDRQEARTKTKYAEMLNRQNEYDRALYLLNEADDKIRGYGHYYDLLWRIELARVFAFVGKRQWGNALLKMRAVLQYRRALGLPNSDIIRLFINRSPWRSNFPP